MVLGGKVGVLTQGLQETDLQESDFYSSGDYFFLYSCSFTVLCLVMKPIAWCADF